MAADDFPWDRKGWLQVPDICPCGRPDHIELIYQLRDALGLKTTAAPVPPKKVWEDTLEIVRQRTRAALAMLPPSAQFDGSSDE